MATPPYKGAGQPPQADDSFWSGLGSWFGGTPAYKPAPTTNANANANTSAIARAIDASNVTGPVVVFVPRGVAAPCDVSDPQQDDPQQ